MFRNCQFLVNASFPCQPTFTSESVLVLARVNYQRVNIDHLSIFSGGNVASFISCQP